MISIVANYQVQLVSRTKTWVTAELQSVGGTGRRAPRLTLGFLLRTPTERVNAEMHHVRVHQLLPKGSATIGEHMY
ncbi:MAG: hypothetical protein ACYDGN_14980 [Acidimicrobiales bacterium]